MALNLPYSFVTTNDNSFVVTNSRLAETNLTYHFEIDTSTNFKYRITYLDSDNNSPAYVRLYILKNGIEISDSPFDMNDVDALDTNYADGKLYTYSKILASGTYTYYFETQDVVASNIIRTITYTNPTVNTITTPSLTITDPT